MISISKKMDREYIIKKQKQIQGCKILTIALGILILILTLILSLQNKISSINQQITENKKHNEKLREYLEGGMD